MRVIDVTHLRFQVLIYLLDAFGEKIAVAVIPSVARDLLLLCFQEKQIPRCARDDNSPYSQPPLLSCEPIGLDAITDAELADGFGQIVAHRALR